MHVYLYDYDKTIAPGDTGSEFWLYCLLRRPYILLLLPFQIIGGVCYLLRICDKLSRVCSIHCYMRFLNAEKLAQGYAKKKLKKTYSYFYGRKTDKPTVVCSASPTFLLKPICDALGVEYLIATDVDPKTGVIQTKVCKFEEKVRRLKEAYPDFVYDEVYSDSLKNDIYILRLGEQAFHVVDGKVRKVDV